MSEKTSKGVKPEKPGATRTRLAGPEKPGKKPGDRGGTPARRGFFTIAEAAACFSAKFFDERICREWVIDRLHPEGARCPECGLKVDDPTTLQNFWAGRRCVCGRCGRKFTATSGTFLSGAQMSYRQAFLLAYLVDIMREPLGTSRIAAAVGVSPDTVRVWIKRFRAFEDKKQDENEKGGKGE